jgi:hypothetical protein
MLLNCLIQLGNREYTGSQDRSNCVLLPHITSHLIQVINTLKMAQRIYSGTLSLPMIKLGSSFGLIAVGTPFLCAFLCASAKKLRFCYEYQIHLWLRGKSCSMYSLPRISVWDTRACFAFPVVNCFANDVRLLVFLRQQQSFRGWAKAFSWNSSELLSTSINFRNKKTVVW